MVKWEYGELVLATKHEDSSKNREVIVFNFFTGGEKTDFSGEGDRLLYVLNKLGEMGWEAYFVGHSLLNDGRIATYSMKRSVNLG